MPPCWATTSVARERCCVPWPQVWEHADHAVQTDCTQCTGHGAAWQISAWDVGPQATPPLAVKVWMERWRHRVPVPQVTEHPPHGVHSDVSQSTGHVWALHSCDCDSGAHSTPPNSTFCAIARVRIFAPAPQLTEHVDQPPHAVRLQSVGHAWELHKADSKDVGHGSPPN